MASFPSVYRARAVHINDGPVLDAFVPQVFGETPILINTYVGGPPTEPGLGWVMFQGGNPEFPVWMGVAAGGNGGGGEGEDEVWIGEEPTDPNIELWVDTGGDGEEPSMFLGQQMWSWGEIDNPPLNTSELAVNAAPLSTTEMYLNKHDLMGIDWSLQVSSLQAGDHITLQFAFDAASWHRYTLIGTPWEDGETIVFPVETSEGSPVGTAPPAGSPILVSFEAAEEAGGPSGYTYVQSTSAATWVIVHNLGYRPNVLVEDSAGTTVEGEIVFNSDNQLTLTFSAAFSGTAYLS